MNRSIRDDRFCQWLLLGLVAVWVITAIRPFNRLDWLLENLLVFAFVGILVTTYRRFAFSNLSYAMIAVFLAMHLVGAHYTYSETPLGFSGFYEALEGLVAFVVSPELGSAYLGTQGDEWDAQKDTALALAGAVIAMAFVWSRSAR